jgi:glycosyltransferase involved in cell wall biosynthesis
MAAAPLISVVVPTRNAGPDIETCLGSLLAQTFGGYEVCVVDAQSTDGTLEKVRAHAGDAVTWTSEPDRGVYDAMNKGIARARGEWLYFLGADDRLHDAEAFSDVAKAAAVSGLDLVYGDVVEKGSGARCGGEFTLERLLFEGNLCHQAVFYHRSLFERLGGYSARYPIWADWEFNIRCFRHPGLRARWIDRPIAVYRERAGLSRQEDPVLRKELPVFLNREIAARERPSLVARLWRRFRR